MIPYVLIPVSDPTSKNHNLCIDLGIIGWLTDFKDLESDSSLLYYSFYFFLGGFLVGAFILSPLADSFGRKTMIFISANMLCIIYLRMVFIHVMPNCAFWLFLAGLFIAIYYCSSVVYLTEITTQGTAVIFVSIFHISFPLSGLAVAVIFKNLGDWKILTSIMSLIPLIIYGYIAYIMESPRLLAAKEFYQDAKRSINELCLYNTGKKKNFEFKKEKDEFIKDYSDFNTIREGKNFQHCYICSYYSGFIYFIGFFLLLGCIGFGLAGSFCYQNPLFSGSYFDKLMMNFIDLANIFICGFIIHSIGYRKTIFGALLCVVTLGFVSKFTAVSSTAYALEVLFMRELLILAFIGAISLAAEDCPARVRATGFGITFSGALIGLIVGGLAYQFLNCSEWIFGIVAVAGCITLIINKEPDVLNLTDDIYEISEFRKSKCKEKAVEEMKVFSKEEHFLILTINGTRQVKGQDEPIGIDQLKISMQGNISQEGSDTKGNYKIQGNITQNSKFTFDKKYTDNTQIHFEGERNGTDVQGTWTIDGDSGSFKFALKLNLWKGEIAKENSSSELEWFLEQAGNTMSGFGSTDKTKYLIHGNVQDPGKAMFTFMNEKGEEGSFEGIINNEGVIQGNNQGGKFTLKCLKA